MRTRIFITWQDPLTRFVISRTITTELVLADLEGVNKRLERVAKDAETQGTKVAPAERGSPAELQPHLDAGRPALTLRAVPGENTISRQFWLMTDKPTIFACNVKEGDLATAGFECLRTSGQGIRESHLACEAVVISAQIESDLVDLSPKRPGAFLMELG